MIEYNWQFGTVLEYWPAFLRGIGVTVQLSVIILIAAIVGGVIIGAARHSKNKFFNWPATVYIEIFRNIPIFVQIVWFFFAFPIIIGVQLDGFHAALFGIGLNTIAYSAEIFRAGIQSIERGQWEAGRAIGMPYLKIMWRVILPQAVRRMIPAFANRMIEIVKSTSIASTIAVGELLYQGQQLANTIYKPMEAYTIVAVVFFLLIYPLALLTYWLERKLDTDVRTNA
jgi:polar amino acid transport system permease protein